MDESMMLFLSANVQPLLFVAAAFVAVIAIVIALCVAAITVFS